MKSVFVVQAKSGHQVIKKNERFLDSSMDPVREAARWCDTACEGANRAEFAIVLGAGSGYHIAALRERCPDLPILILECDGDVAREAKRICPALNAEKWLIQPDTSQLIASSCLRDFLAGHYAVLRHRPSMEIEAEYFNFVEKLLLGRDKIGFLLLLKTRPELYSILNPESIAGLTQTKDNELVSIKTIQKMFSNRATYSRERRLWKVLEELVV